MPDRGHHRPTICLSMIVRDEAHVVTEALESVVPYLDHWVVVDTGSADDTMDVVERFFAARGVHPDAAVLYLHTKGATHDGTPGPIDDWRRLLLHFCVERADDCLRAYDAVGCERATSPSSARCPRATATKRSGGC